MNLDARAPLGGPNTLQRRHVTQVPLSMTGSWPVAEGMSTHRTLYVPDCRTMLEGFTPRVWDELPPSAVVIPIVRDTDDAVPSAVMILGLSPRLPFNEEYEAFIHSLRNHMAGYLVAVRTYCADQELIEQLARVDRAKNLLITNVANDLLTPLFLIAGPLDDVISELPMRRRGTWLTISRAA